VEVTDNEKHSSLVRYGISYGREDLNSISPWIISRICFYPKGN